MGGKWNGTCDEERAITGRAKAGPNRWKKTPGSLHDGAVAARQLLFTLG